MSICNFKSGFVNPVLPVCRTFMDFIWNYFKALYHHILDKEIRQQMSTLRDFSNIPYDNDEDYFFMASSRTDKSYSKLLMTSLVALADEADCCRSATFADCSSRFGRVLDEDLSLLNTTGGCAGTKMICGKGGSSSKFFDVVCLDGSLFLPALEAFISAFFYLPFNACFFSPLLFFVCLSFLLLKLLSIFFFF